MPYILPAVARPLLIEVKARPICFYRRASASERRDSVPVPACLQRLSPRAAFPRLPCGLKDDAKHPPGLRAMFEFTEKA